MAVQGAKIYFKADRLAANQARDYLAGLFLVDYAQRIDTLANEFVLISLENFRRGRIRLQGGAIDGLNHRRVR